MIYNHHSSYLCIPDINTMSLMFDRWSMLIVLYFVFYRDKYRVFNVQHKIYDLRSSSVSLQDKNTMSMFDRWSVIIVLYFVFYRYEYRVLNVRQIIYDQHSSYLFISDFIPCPYYLTYHLWPSFYMFVSSRVQSVLIVRYFICEHRCFCLCHPEINTVPLTFNISSIIIVVFIRVLRR